MFTLETRAMEVVVRHNMWLAFTDLLFPAVCVPTGEKSPSFNKLHLFEVSRRRTIIK